jgi:hypothetical protein
MASARDRIRMSADEVEASLDQEQVLTCATNSCDGWPHLAPLNSVLVDGMPCAWTYAVQASPSRRCRREPRNASPARLPSESCCASSSRATWDHRKLAREAARDACPLAGPSDTPMDRGIRDLRPCRCRRTTAMVGVRRRWR